MALTEDTMRRKVDSPRLKIYPARSNVVFYKGAIVAKRRDSNLVEIPLAGSPRTDLIAVGIASHFLDTTGKTDGELSLVVEPGIHGDFATHASAPNKITTAHQDQRCYMYDDSTLYATDNGGTISPAGTVALVEIDEISNETIVCVHFDYDQPDLQERLETLSDGIDTSMADVVALEEALNIQTGVATLVAGTVTISAGVTITANSTVLVSLRTPGAGIRGEHYKVDQYVVGAPGVGSFRISSVDTAGGDNLVNTCVDTVRYAVLR